MCEREIARENSSLPARSPVVGVVFEILDRLRSDIQSQVPVCRKVNRLCGKLTSAAAQFTIYLARSKYWDQSAGCPSSRCHSTLVSTTHINFQVRSTYAYFRPDFHVLYPLEEINGVWSARGKSAVGMRQGMRLHWKH